MRNGDGVPVCTKHTRIVSSGPSILFFLATIASILFVLAIVVAWPANSHAADAKFPKEKIEQLVAPIALYPDPLLAQVLMASSYPLEIVQAARWSKANPKVQGKALEEAMLKQPWDPSVKALTAVPSALQMMNEQLEWTQQLGDAFLAQQADLLDAVQRLRKRAQDAGKLQTTSQQKVTSQSKGGSGQVIVIESANPKVVYVPVYNPTVIYGSWPYPAYPPYSYYPPGYVATANIVSFGVGVAVGAAIWGNCNWGSNNVNIDVNRYNQFNKANINNPSWNHNPQHRQGVPYRDSATADRFGKAASRDTASREQFRGRAESGKMDLSARDAKAPTTRQDRPRDQSAKSAQKKAGPSPRAANTDRNRSSPKAFDNMGGRGSDVRQHSDRGRASRQGSGGGVRAANREGGGGGRGGGRGGGGRRR